MKFSEFFVVMGLLVCAVFADISVSSYEVSPSTLKPGTSGTVTLTISNAGTAIVKGIELASGSGGGITTDERINVGDLSSGGSTIISVPFKIKSGTPTGIYNFRASIVGYSEGTDLYGRTVSEYVQRTFTVPITVTNPPTFQMETRTEKVYADDDFNITGTIHRTEGEAYNTRLSVDSDNFIQLGKVPKILGDARARTDFTIPLTSRAGTPSGKYSIPIILTYEDSLGQEGTNTLYFNVDVNKRSPDFIIETETDRPFAPGETVALTVRVRNSGDSDAYGVRVKLVDGTNVLKPLSSSEVYMGDIGAGQSKSTVQGVGVGDVAPGFYNANFELSYKDRNGEEQAPETVSIGANIVAKNEISVFASSNPAPIAPDGAYTLSLTISNVGSSPIKALSVEVDSEIIDVLEAQKGQFIGGLEADDYSTIQYKIYVKSIEPGKYPVSVTARYKDAFNNEHVEEQEVDIEVVSSSIAARSHNGKEQDNALCYGAVALVVIAAAGYFGYNKFFRKKGK